MQALDAMACNRISSFGYLLGEGQKKNRNVPGPRLYENNLNVSLALEDTVGIPIFTEKKILNFHSELQLQHRYIHPTWQ